jgi:hypothetical protein
MVIAPIVAELAEVAVTVWADGGETEINRFGLSCHESSSSSPGLAVWFRNGDSRGGGPLPRCILINYPASPLSVIIAKVATSCPSSSTELVA